MRGELVRSKLHNGEHTFGMTFTSLLNPLAMKILATNINLDWAFICTEHMPLDRRDVAAICQFLAASDIAPVVRLASVDPVAAAMAVDAGAHGIAAPYVESPEQVASVIGAVKYRPIKGKKLDELGTDPGSIDQTTREFLNDYNKDTFVLVGIESGEAIKRLDEIMDIDGIDGLYVGPHDLSISMGMPLDYDNPRFVDVLENVIRRARARGLGAGTLIDQLETRPETFKRCIDAGMNWIGHSSDLMILYNSFNEQRRQLQEMCDEERSIESEKDVVIPQSVSTVLRKRTRSCMG